MKVGGDLPAKRGGASAYGAYGYRKPATGTLRSIMAMSMTVAAAAATVDEAPFWPGFSGEPPLASSPCGDAGPCDDGPLPASDGDPSLASALLAFLI